MRGLCYPCVYVDGYLSEFQVGREDETVVLLMVIAMNEDEYRKLLCDTESIKENKTRWINFFQLDNYH